MGRAAMTPYIPDNLSPDEAAAYAREQAEQQMADELEAGVYDWEWQEYWENMENNWPEVF